MADIGPTRTAARLILSGILIASTPIGAAATPRTASGVAAPSKLFSDGRTVVRDRFSVEIVGRGPDIVLIPGIASPREVWRHTAERLRGRYRVHLVQVAGFAGEPARSNGDGPVFDPLVTALDEYLATLPRPATVIGHSMGGALALALVERHPAHVSRVMIVDALPFFGTLIGGPDATAQSIAPAVDAITAGLADQPEDKVRTNAVQMATSTADVDRLVAWNRASDPAVVRRATRDDMLADLRPALSAVRVPVTVVYETPLKPAMVPGYAPLPVSRLVEVPDAKHFIMLDQPARFDAAVDAFLAEKPL